MGRGGGQEERLSEILSSYEKRVDDAGREERRQIKSSANLSGGFNAGIRTTAADRR